MSIFRKKYWMEKKGLTEEEAILKVKEIQNNNVKKRSKESYKNMLMPWEEEYWLSKGFSKKEAEQKIKKTKNKLSINSLDENKKKEILQKRKKTYYSKTIQERNKINKSRGKTKEQYIKEHGEEEANRILKEKGKGRRNSSFRRYSKSSKQFFNELQQHVNYELLYAEKEQWIKYDSNKGFYVDCLYKNKIIEFNGDFYHANPTIYEAESVITISKIKVKKAKEIWKKDEFKIKKLQKLGYDVLIIWEADIVKNKKEVLNKCIKFLKNE